MPSQDKLDKVEELSKDIGRASALYFLDFTKVGVNEFNGLRRQLGDVGAAVKIVKNRLALRALSASGVEADLGGMLRGPTSVVFAGEDPVAPARVIKGVQKTLESLQFKGAYLDAAVYPADQFGFLAGLPTKDELRAELVGVLHAPIAEFAFGLEGLLSEMLFVLEQLQGRKAEAPAAG
jgi:large subunit ribosomal protein L10